MAALWRNFQTTQRNFQTYMNLHPSPEVAEMQAWIASLENEVSNLKGLEPEVARLQDLLEDRDQEIKAQDQAIAGERRKQEVFRCEAREANAREVEVSSSVSQRGQNLRQLGRGSWFFPSSSFHVRNGSISCQDCSGESRGREGRGCGREGICDRAAKER